jgi:hypothetical protein
VVGSAGASIEMLLAVFVEMDAAVAHVGVGGSGPSAPLVGAPSGGYRLPFGWHFCVGAWFVSEGCSSRMSGVSGGFLLVKYQAR